MSHTEHHPQVHETLAHREFSHFASTGTLMAFGDAAVNLDGTLSQRYGETSGLGIVVTRPGAKLGVDGIAAAAQSGDLYDGPVLVVSGADTYATDGELLVKLPRKREGDAQRGAFGTLGDKLGVARFRNSTNGTLTPASVEAGKPWGPLVETGNGNPVTAVILPGSTLFTVKQGSRKQGRNSFGLTGPEPTPQPSAMRSPMPQAQAHFERARRLNVERYQSRDPQKFARVLGDLTVRSTAQSQRTRHERTQTTRERVLPTFAEARKGRKVFSEAFVVAALNKELQIIRGEKAFFLKSYFDNVPPDKSDEVFASSEGAVLRFHDELADFIASRVHIRFKPSTIPEGFRSALSTSRQDYIDRLQSDKKLVASWVHGWRTGSRPSMPYGAYTYKGLQIGDANQAHDLTEGGFSNIRSNIYVQRDIVGHFVHFGSAQYEKTRLKGERPDLAHRIYLNPTAASSVEVFGRVVDAADAQGLTMKGKIYDRLSAAIEGPKRTKAGQMEGLRGDGIVLYSTAAEVDSLLGIVDTVYQDTYSRAFKGRATSRVPYKIAEGVAIGDEPGIDDESLTSHRSSVLEGVLEKSRERLGIRNLDGKIPPSKHHLATSIFAEEWEKAARAAKINPHNFAFNA